MICNNIREHGDGRLELWRKAIENNGLRISRSKTEYLPPSSCHDSKVKLAQKRLKNVTTFTYIGSMFDAEGGSTADCKNRVRLTWNRWRAVGPNIIAVMSAKKVPVCVKLNHSIYKTGIKPALTFGAEF